MINKCGENTAQEQKNKKNIFLFNFFFFTKYLKFFIKKNKICMNARFPKQIFEDIKFGFRET